MNEYERAFFYEIERKLSPTKWEVKENGCWEWQRGCNSNGQAEIQIFGITTLAYRAMMMKITQKHIPEGLVVMHSCDNPKCVNPNHLSIGTVSANAIDSV